MFTTLLNTFLAVVCFCIQVSASERTYSEDSSQGTLKGWTLPKRVKASVVGEGDDAFLRTKGHSRTLLPLPAGKWRNFDLSFDTRGNGGVHFRNGYKVFFKPSGTVWIRRPGAMLLRWVREKRDISKFHTLRIVCAGPIIRIYVDKVLELECLDYNVRTAPILLRGAADFDNIRLTGAVLPDEALIALPQDAGADFFEELSYARLRPSGPRVKDTALAFKADQEIVVPVQVVHGADDSRTITLNTTVDRFDGKPVWQARGQPVSLGGGGIHRQACKVGKLAPGFYRLRLALRAGEKFVRTSDYPLFVGVPEQVAKTKAPDFPVGLFLRSIVWKPVHTKTYWYGMAGFMDRHHFNTVIATGGCHREFPEIFAHFGISTLVRSPNRLYHPAVLAYLNTASRPKRIIELHRTIKKPVLTYHDLSAVGSGSEKDPLQIWKKTRPKLRMVRIWPFAEGEKAMGLPKVAELLGKVHPAAETPWWAVIQTHGSKQAGKPVRKPTPAELSAVTHLALAYGAKGLLYYSLQGLYEDRGLVDTISLQPIDQRAATLGRLAKTIAAHARFLKELKPQNQAVRSSVAHVIAQLGRADGVQFIYAVNLDTNKATKAHLSWITAEQLKGAKDLYTSQDVGLDSKGISVTLSPGQGRLIRLNHK